MTGMHSSQSVIRSGVNSISPNSGMSPKANPTTPATVAATGSTILGNAICLISRSCDATDVVASPIEAVNHFHGRIAAKMNSG